MTKRWTTWLAVALWVIAITLAAVAIVLRHAIGETTFGRPLLVTLLLIALQLSLATVGALLGAHRPANPIGWIFLATAMANNASVIASHYATYTTDVAPGRLPDLVPLYWVGGWSYLVFFILPVTFGILLFPTGRLPSRRWRPFAWFVGCWLGLLVFAEMFSPGPLDPESDGAYAHVSNPLGVESLTWLFDAIHAADEFTFLMPFLGPFVSVIVRLRRASAIERQQIKWFAYAASIPVVGFVVEQVIYEMSQTASEGDETAGSFIALAGIALLPVAIGIAILRHNLYDIDRLINRTLVYGLLTLSLLATYFTVVLSLAGLARAITGESSPVIVAVSTLVVAGLFRPLRERIQSTVDRRFYRRRYDAVRILSEFNSRLRDETDLETLTANLCGAARETMQPAHVSLWLRPITTGGGQ